MDVGVDESFRCRPAGFLGRLGNAGFAEDFDGLIQVALRFGESFLAIHNAGPGTGTEFADHVGCDGAHVVPISFRQRVRCPLSLRESASQSRERSVDISSSASPPAEYPWE